MDGAKFGINQQPTYLRTPTSIRHNLEWTTAEAVRSIDKALAANRNFFLFYTPTCPHSPSAETAMMGFSVRDTPSGTLSSDPISGMPSRDSVISRAPTDRTDSWIGTIWADDSLVRAMFFLLLRDDGDLSLFADPARTSLPSLLRVL